MEIKFGEYTLPAKYEVCPRCNGTGTHVNPSIDGNGITASEWAERCHNDPDFAEDYVSGKFDVRCEECNGLRVVLVPDEDRADDGMLKLYYDEQAADAAYEAERAAERRMGA